MTSSFVLSTMPFMIRCLADELTSMVTAATAVITYDNHVSIAFSEKERIVFRGDLL